MIFGKTKQQKQEARETWRQAFAYCPVELWDGRWVFWQPYWTRFSKTPPDGFGVFMQPVTQNFLELPEQFRPTTPKPPKK